MGEDAVGGAQWEEGLSYPLCSDELHVCEAHVLFALASRLAPISQQDVPQFSWPSNKKLGVGQMPRLADFWASHQLSLGPLPSGREQSGNQASLLRHRVPFWRGNGGVLVISLLQNC